MATVSVHCPRCNSDEVYSHGHSTSLHERFQCRSCKRVIQLTYTYEARKPGVKDKIVDMAHNGGGVRDTARTRRVGINTVIRALKSSRPAG
ncbi:TPA: IS1-like element transposase [Serratia fonticola]